MSAEKLKKNENEYKAKLKRLVLKHNAKIFKTQTRIQFAKIEKLNDFELLDWLIKFGDEFKTNTFYLTPSNHKTLFVDNL